MANTIRYFDPSQGAKTANHPEFRPVRNYRGAGRLALAAGIALSVSGCAFNGADLTKVSHNSKIVTHSVAEPAKQAGVVVEDAEIIKQAVAEAPEKPGTSALAWANPNTGSSGTIVAIDKFMGKHGQQCRGFKTTVATFMGIAFYDGEACQISPGEWVLSWFKPQDSRK